MPEGSTAGNKNGAAQLTAQDQVQPSSQQQQLSELQALCKHICDLELGEEGGEIPEKTVRELDNNPLWSWWNGLDEESPLQLQPSPQQRSSQQIKPINKARQLIKSVDDRWLAVQSGTTTEDTENDLEEKALDLIYFLHEWRHNDNSDPMPALYSVMQQFGKSHETLLLQQQQTQAEQLAAICTLADETLELLISGTRVQLVDDGSPSQETMRSKMEDLEVLMGRYEDAMLSQVLHQEPPDHYDRMKNALEVIDNLLSDRQQDKKTIMKMGSKRHYVDSKRNGDDDHHSSG